ncbi:MAG: hypothetical protein ABIH49_01890 [archaeon]
MIVPYRDLSEAEFRLVEGLIKPNSPNRDLTHQNGSAYRYVAGLEEGDYFTLIGNRINDRGLTSVRLSGINRTVVTRFERILNSLQLGENGN